MSIATVAARQQKLIRKAQDAVIFAGPEAAPEITAITENASADLVALPFQYRSLGHHTEEDGINWTRDVSSEDVRSHGSSEPTRRDIVSDVTGLVVLAQETKAVAMEMFHNVSLATVTPDATTKEIRLTRARTPATRYYRLLALASDGAGGDTIYFARFCPRASVTDFAEQPWTKATEVRWPLTFTAYVDDDLGYAMSEMWGGPGIADLIDAMGFGASEVQNIAITGTPTGGTFTLTLESETTTAIAFDATATVVQTALEGLALIDPGDVTVTGGPGPDTAWVATFGGKYAHLNVPLMTGDATGLTGGTSPAIVVTNP